LLNFKRHMNPFNLQTRQPITSYMGYEYQDADAITRPEIRTPDYHRIITITHTFYKGSNVLV
jgi:hypothetical protein